ncbi:polyketide synthase dehydratase domain-containing protein [Streptomyces sp. A244]|uniref:polyketide synthase dehydratase domain-containing protein n=1 Tax=Streptomyces sp. A244 TaxID=2137016 RepID=UPI0035BEEF9D
MSGARAAVWSSSSGCRTRCATGTGSSRCCAARRSTRTAAAPGSARPPSPRRSTSTVWRWSARLHVPDGGRAGAQSLHCHPVALDTCLQAVAAAVLRTGAVPAGGTLPRRIEALRLYGRVPLSGYCLVTLTGLQGGRFTADFRLWADDGSVIADATGVEFRHVPAESPEERFANRLLQISWVPGERPAARKATGDWYLLAEPGRASYAAALGRALRELAAAVDVRWPPPAWRP